MDAPTAVKGCNFTRLEGHVQNNGHLLVSRRDMLDPRSSRTQDTGQASRSESQGCSRRHDDMRRCCFYVFSLNVLDHFAARQRTIQSYSPLPPVHQTRLARTIMALPK